MNKDLIEVWGPFVFGSLVIRSVGSIPAQLSLHLVWGYGESFDDERWILSCLTQLTGVLLNCR